MATTLPLTDQPFQTGRAGAVPAFFAGLLPEGRRLSGLRMAVKTSLDDELSLLLAIGNDTVGDVHVVPAGSAPTALTPLLSVQREGSEVRFATVLAESGVVDPIGIAGVRDKASARMISVPVATAGERYLLKLDPPEYPHVVANEAFFLRIGLPARASERALDRLVERCRDLADQVADHPWAYRSDVVDRWVAELRYRHRHLTSSS